MGGWANRWTERLTDRWTVGHADINNRQATRQTYRERDIQIDRQTETDRHSLTYVGWKKYRHRGVETDRQIDR